MHKEMKKYMASLYLRISKDDGNEIESVSIENQRNIIYNFIKKREDIIVYNERIDDGYSGMNFERPEFKHMMEDIKENRVNCIIVKDFSRFGRNYISVGKYLEELFPYVDIRFISVNDNYDSNFKDDATDFFVVPFKNLLNDAYSRDISMKTKISLNIKRKQGYFVSPFTVYGYKKSEENKNVIIVDDFAAKVVFDIFREVIKGKNINSIAEYLNYLGVPSPSDYKKRIGSKYVSGLKVNLKSTWSYNAVKNILRNNIYIGTLEQGKSTTENYAKRKTIKKNKNEWIKIKNNHKEIINKQIFDLANENIDIKTRINGENDVLYYFSAKLFCAQCKKNMVRRRSIRDDKEYIYYTCKTNKKLKNMCSSHRINEGELEKICFKILKTFVNEFVFYKYSSLNMGFYGSKNKLDILNNLVMTKKIELDKCLIYKENVLNAFNNEIITFDDYNYFNDFYSKQYNEIKSNIKNIENELNKKDVDDISKLTKTMINCFIKKINVYEKKRIEIFLNFKDIF